MGRKVSIGITADYIREGKFVVPGPGLDMLEGMENVEYAPLPAAKDDGSKDFDPGVVQPGQIERCDMVASIAPRWDISSLAGNDRLLSVHRHGVGFDMVNVPELTDCNVLLCTTPKAIMRPMGVVVLTYLLLLSTRYPIKNKLAKENRWVELPKYPGYGLTGKTLGFVGAGRIARETMKLAQALDMKYIVYDPYIQVDELREFGAEPVDLDTLLCGSDYVSICCPLNDSTRHLIGAAELAKMKPSAFLINAARGPIVDERALIEALRNNVIQGAGIDVFEEEPTSPDNPLFHMDNVAATPHALGWTDQAVMGIWTEIVSQMSCIMRGEMPDGVINGQVWVKPGFRAKLERFLDETKVQI